MIGPDRTSDRLAKNERIAKDSEFLPINSPVEIGGSLNRTR